MFKVGDEVFFGIHGKCVITGISEKEYAGDKLAFYEMKVQKNPLIPNQLVTNGPTILVPVRSAAEKGLRPAASATEAQAILDAIDKSHWDDLWELRNARATEQKRIEEILRIEGISGLARVVAYLFQRTGKDCAPPTAITKLYESLYRQLVRETAVATGKAHTDIEKELNRRLRANQQHNSAPA